MNARSNYLQLAGRYLSSIGVELPFLHVQSTCPLPKTVPVKSMVLPAILVSAAPPVTVMMPVVETVDV